VHNDWAVIVEGKIHLVEVEQKQGVYEVHYKDKLYCIETQWSLGSALFHATIKYEDESTEKVCFQIQREGIWYHLFHRGARTEALVTTPNNARLQGYMLEKEPADLSKFLLSPMPGLLIKLSAEEGMEVKAGDELVVVEAMKMENILRAEQDCVISKINANVGDSLVVDQVIIEFE
jgi:propionyl-CoA carboxylase alpha chain